uniref:Sodium:alanine symporter family protein n=1 Tax=Candidatus Aschnera chinzeii TaxID=1485666 RepID=A0AAT9G4Q4_9ENTR|nr:MAG: sodium:alanine symporter family protein [Candidatus Aschnera chinzeii]
MKLLENINNLLWNNILIYLLLIIGIYFSIKTNLIQLRHFTYMFTILKNSYNTKTTGISSFQILCTTLAGRVGTGNLTGVAIALTTGGPGAIFWMWIISLIGMATSFVESTLAQLYKIKDQHGYYRGGPAHYMKYGLNMPYMGIIFSICLIISLGLIFNAVQANSIAQAMFVAFNFNPLHIGIILAILCAIIIFRNLYFIIRVIEYIVPIMAITYLSLAFIVIINNIEKIPHILLLIVNNAFGLREATCGTIAYNISQTIMQGIERGLFSNEAGMGSSATLAATASPYPPHPISQGYIQMISVFIDTIVICTATSIIILSSGILENNIYHISGIKLTQLSLASTFGKYGINFIAIAILFFAYTSIIANYICAENSVLFLDKNHSLYIYILRLTTIIMIIVGSLIDMPIIWKLADICMGIMTLINLLAIIMLSKTFLKLHNDYNQQRKNGKLPIFNIQLFPEINKHFKKSVWKNYL